MTMQNLYIHVGTHKTATTWLQHYLAKNSDLLNDLGFYYPTSGRVTQAQHRLGQAISRLRAEQTGLWHRAADGRELERLAPPAPPRFDRAAIARRMAKARALDGAWTAWFAAQGIRPLRIPYDALARDPGGVVARLLAALGLDPAAARGIDPPTARLADDVSAAWRRRFEQGG